MPRSVLRRMFVSRAVGIHDTADHHHAGLSSCAVAYRPRRSRYLQHGILDSAIHTSLTVVGDIRAIHGEILGPLQGRTNRSSSAGLVPARLVLYSVIAV